MLKQNFLEAIMLFPSPNQQFQKLNGQC